MELKNYFAQDAEGNAQPYASCYLYSADTTNLINGLVDAANQPLTNPFVSDSYGLIQFKAPNGIYDLRVISGNRDYKIRVQAADVSELIEGIADAVAAADAATAAADLSQSKADIAAAAATNAVDARDDAESYAVDVLSSVTEVNNNRILAQQAVFDAENAAETRVTILRDELADPNRGVYTNAWVRHPLSQRIDNAGKMLDAQYFHPYENAHLVTNKPDLDDPSTWDWKPAIEATLNAAFAFRGVPQMYSANVNHSGIVVDLGGLSYGLGSYIQVPDGGGVTIQNGLLFALNGFTSTNLVRMGMADAGSFRHENVKWDKVIFDCRHKAGGVLVSNSLRIRFTDCTLLRYLTDGIRTLGNCVEIHVVNSDFGTSPWNNTNASIGDKPEVVGVQVGLRLGSTDNRIIGCIFHRGRAIIAQAQAQHITACQFYGSDLWGSAIDILTSDVTVVDCAFGKFGIRVYNPFNVIISNNMFVMENTGVNDWAISLIPQSASQFMSGVQIFGNDFRRVGGSEVCKSVVYDTSQGTITRVRSSRVRDNGHFYVRESCLTQHTKQVFVTAATTSTFDFSDVVEFGSLSRVNTEFMQSAGQPGAINCGTDGNISQLTRAVIPVKLSATASGTIQVTISVEESPLIV